MSWGSGSAATSAQRVYRKLKHDIVTCALAPGRALSEPELCRRYRTSRTPVREACHHLEREGLIEIIPYRGYRVPPLTMAEYHNLNEIQLIVEPTAAALAAQRISSELLQRLQHFVTPAYRLKDTRSYYDFLEANYRLHVGIAEASANEPLQKIVAEVHTRLMRFFYLVISMDAYGPELTAEHRGIVQAIASHDPERARRAMTDHILRTMQRSMNLLVHSRYAPLRFPGLSEAWRTLPLVPSHPGHPTPAAARTRTPRRSP